MKICVFTAARSDYFILRPLLHALKSDPFFELQLIVSGMHVIPEFGETWKLILEDGFEITEKISMSLSGNQNTDTVVSMGLGMIQFSEVLKRLSPDRVIILGDRFEMMSFSLSAYILRLPIVHIHGGELTYGAFDDGIRHCITKLASLHFASAEIYRKRIVQMGEHPDSVYNVGALAVDNVKEAPDYDLPTLSKKIGVSLQKNFFLVTAHPETCSYADSLKQVKILIEALQVFSEYQIIWTIANADPQGRKINTYLREIQDEFCLVENLGKYYLPLLKKARVVIGNSSSGVIEAPIVGVPTVNIGERQAGRLRAPSVIDCEWNADSIQNSIQSALLLKNLHQYAHPFGDGQAASQIIKMLKRNHPEKYKGFYDLPSVLDTVI